MSDIEEKEAKEIYAYHGQRTCYKFPSNIIAIKTLKQSDQLSDEYHVENLVIKKEGKRGFLVEAISSCLFVEHYDPKATSYSLVKLYIITSDSVYPLTIKARYSHENNAITFAIHEVGSGT